MDVVEGLIEKGANPNAHMKVIKLSVLLTLYLISIISELNKYNFYENSHLILKKFTPKYRIS